MKLATKRSLIQTHSSYANGSGAHEGTGVTPGVLDVPKYGSDDEQISWKSSDEEDDDDDEANVGKDKDDDDHDDDDERTKSDNDGEDFVHPKVQTPSYVSTTNDDNNDEVQCANIEEEKMDEETTHEKNKANELYRDVNVNREGRDTEMTDAPIPNVQGTQVIEDTHVIITALMFRLLQLLSRLFLSTTTLPPPPTPLIIHLQQTPVLSPATVPSSFLQDLPNFGSLFRFDHRLKTLEIDFSELKQINQFAETVSSIPDIVDAYLANKMNESIKTAVQLQSDRLRDAAQAENEDFFNSLDDNIKKIIKDQVKQQVKAHVSKILPRIENTVNEQLEAEVMTRSSTESNTSHTVAANLSELELKKILIDKMESNKSIHRSDEQKNLYKAFVEAYESDKFILDTYGDIVSFKRRRDDEDKDEEPSAGSNRGDDDKLYKFKEGDFNRLHIQDIKDMLLLLVQGKLTNLTIEERLAFNVFLRMFTRSVVIQRRVEDLQLGVESYQKKLNLTKPDTYRTDLKRKEAYTAYFNPKGFIYQNKDKKNRLIHIDELHKFSDGTLDDVRTALNDCLKGIRMQYLPQTIWRQRDKDNAGAMIQAIDKLLKTRRIMQSLEKFVGGKSYEEHAEFDESNTHVLERFYTSAGNPVKEILLKLNLPDHRKLKDGGEVKEFQRSFCHSDTERLSQSDEVLKLKNFKKDATLKLFKSTNQERYEHVGPKSQVSQDGKVH
ncbi:hypothetical protein Tco_0885325 [Tanacetum coccineum]